MLCQLIWPCTWQTNFLSWSCSSSALVNSCTNCYLCGRAATRANGKLLLPPPSGSRQRMVIWEMVSDRLLSRKSCWVENFCCWVFGPCFSKLVIFLVYSYYCKVVTNFASWSFSRSALVKSKPERLVFGPCFFQHSIFELHKLHIGKYYVDLFQRQSLFLN